MLLRAITLKREPYPFELKDCPIFINDSIVALTNKPGSPLLQAKTIMRGDDETGVFESDFVFRKDTFKLVGYVVYVDRFYILDYKTYELTPLDENAMQTYDFSSNLQSADIVQINKARSYILFRIENITFRINSLIRVVSDKYLYLSRKNTDKLDLSTLAFCTGLKRNGNDLCFGDLMQDGVIVLHNFKPMVRLHSGRYRDLMEGEYDG